MRKIILAWAVNVFLSDLNHEAQADYWIFQKDMAGLVDDYFTAPILV